MVDNKKWWSLRHSPIFYLRANSFTRNQPQFFCVLMFRVRPRLLRAPLPLLAVRAIRCVLGERGALPLLQT